MSDTEDDDWARTYKPPLTYEESERERLRDYFAGQALAATSLNEYADNDLNYGSIAANCYRIADAMLKARES